jgi:DNA polymerase I-like protein with 3'-5' exonuclease and polymerase domains
MSENFPQNGNDLAEPIGEITPLFADFESFYSQDYTLQKLDPASYILDPRFEAICLGVANLTDPPTLIDGPEIPHFIKTLKEHRRHRRKPICMVSHNAQFDMAIMSWRYDFHPDLIIDTMSMSRTVLGPLLRSHSLASVADFLGLPGKGSMVKDVKGMTRADIIACGLWKKEVEYCLHDTWLCREIYKTLFQNMPADEFVLHDILTRCTTEPVLRVDRPMLQVHLETVLQQKATVLATVESMGIGKAHLMSNPKLADVLRSLGVEPPKKISPQTDEETYAFARTDEEFTDLLEHPNQMVRAVVEARLETKSTIEETRTRRFLAISNLEFPDKGDCIMPMPVIIGGAHTHRVSGGWDLNVQNMGRGSTLRDAIHAEDGYQLLVVDSKQIECRDCAWFCDQTDLLQEFREGQDVYCNFANVIFDRKITKENKPERFIGKTGRLQLGYSSGWVKFQNTVRVNSIKEMGTPMLLADWQAQDIVNKYRASHRAITWMWKVLDNMLGLMAHNLPQYGEGNGETIKCVTFYRNLMIGPTGLAIHFPDLHWKDDPLSPFGGSWWFRDGKRWRRTYGASLLETICQHVARCIVFGAAVRLRNPMASLRSRLVHSAHDELVYMVPVENIETAKIWAQTEMNRPPSFAPDMPLDCDIGVAHRYGEAK